MNDTPISERIRQALDGTTPSPWEWQDDGPWVAAPSADGTDETLVFSVSWWKQEIEVAPADANLMAAAPTLLTDAADEIDRLMALLSDFIDPSPCDLDHHGTCQGHGFFLEHGETCPQQQLRDLFDLNTPTTQPKDTSPA